MRARSKQIGSVLAPHAGAARGPQRSRLAVRACARLSTARLATQGKGEGGPQRTAGAHGKGGTRVQAKARERRYLELVLAHEQVRDALRVVPARAEWRRGDGATRGGGTVRAFLKGKRRGFNGAQGGNGGWRLTAGSRASRACGASWAAWA